MTKLTLFTVAILAMIAVFLFATKSYKEKQAETVQRIAQSADSPLKRSNVPTIGTIMAKVEIVEFFDPACEGCRAFHPYVKSVLNNHGPQVRLLICSRTWRRLARTERAAVGPMPLWLWRGMYVSYERLKRGPVPHL